MQARIASEHGKQVYLVRSLVTEQEWAQRMIARGEAIEIEHVEDVVSRLATPERVHAVSDHRQQLALEIL